MAGNYNLRSGSSDSHRRRHPQSGRGSAKTSAQTSARISARAQQQLDRPPLEFNRNKIEYIQSATNDLIAKTPPNDPRTRYARFRSNKTVRVLGDPRESNLKELHQINGPYAGENLPFADGGGEGYGSRGSSGRQQGRQSGGQQERATRDTPQMTVREHRERQRATRRRRSKVPGRILIVFAIIATLVLAAFFVYQSSLFAVQEVQVEGTQRLTSERLTELAAIPESSTLLRLDDTGIQSRLETDPWIESAEVRRAFPSTIVLAVVERKIAMVVEIPVTQDGMSTQRWLVSKDGIWLGSVNAQSSSTSVLEGARVGVSELVQWPPIKEVVQSVSPQIGAKVTDEGVLNALAIVNGFTPDMLALVRSISAPDRVKTTIALTNNVEIAFGAAEDIEAKEQVIRTLLAEHEGKITYINVRVADRATFRATG
ncbi:MAG: FtsQ-type POTRA domain-containing protein [Coriobacteriales bacterium]|jgi:cell division protein FtsQ|nr:FtsQ-type POTRA domain-containing protein [Coriobacteriales bacterium]